MIVIARLTGTKGAAARFRAVSGGGRGGGSA
jgi:hypothetical protein